MNAIVTRESLSKMLEKDPVKVVGRALVALFKAGQTEAERAANVTEVWNGVGFSGADARSASLTAKYFIKHGTLLDWQVANWTKPARNGFPRLCKYAKQLNAIAEAKRVAEFKAEKAANNAGDYAGVAHS